MPNIKLKNVEILMNILDPLLVEKCGGILSWEILNLINALQPHLDKIEKVKTKIKDDYGKKNEDGSFKTTKNEQGLDIIVFGDNQEKVEKELNELMETEIKIKDVIHLKNVSNDVKIAPLNLKFLSDLELLIK